MEKRWFDGYGWLEWLEPVDYYGDPWWYVVSAEGDDGERYDIVRDHDATVYRYTNV